MKLVILTGAGMSAESGIKTFRDSDGLWENYRIEDVCTPEALERNPELVNHFYNIDDLHERAGSKHVLHLHGELKKVRSSKNPDSIYDLKGWELKPGTRCEDGSLLRPHVVFFGEAVPNIEPATDLVRQADIFVIIGTSLNVYPAAGLLHYVPRGAEVYLIDPKPVDTHTSRSIHVIQKGASEGMGELKQLLGV